MLDTWERDWDSGNPTMETSPIMVDRKREEAREMKKRLVEGELLMEKPHRGKGHVAITKFAYISPTAMPTRAYAKNRLQF